MIDTLKTGEIVMNLNISGIQRIGGCEDILVKDRVLCPVHCFSIGLICQSFVGRPDQPCGICLAFGVQSMKS